MRLRVIHLHSVFLLAGLSCFSAGFDPSGELDKYNVVWTSPSANAHGSMPIGNGDVGQ